MKQAEKQMVALSAVVAVACILAVPAGAMHIMEGYLPAGYSLAWGALCIPFVMAGALRIRNIVAQQRRTLLLLAMSGAYAFVLSALKLPSVTGSSSHPTGMGLGAILFGPAPMAVLGIIVLLFQAILLAHGGLTTLGANTFSMAIAGPLLTWGVYMLCKKLRINKLVAVFCASCLGNLFTYVVTSAQLALAYPSEVGGAAASLVKFTGVFALTQIPLAVVEGLLTVVVLVGLESYAKPELREIGYLEERGAHI